ncbi:MAG: hypothetical protein OER80_13435 [Gammaproteobacteria bacterium]|nr:hypothetical protein [Gammaproteobacteria bacterium]
MAAKISFSDSAPTTQTLLDEIGSLRKQLADSKATTQSEDYDSLFAQFPLGMQEEDYSQVKIFIDNLQAEDAVDIKQYFEDNPKVVLQLMKSIHVTNVNQAMLDMTHDETAQGFLDGEVDVDSWWNARWAAYCAAEFAALASPSMTYEDESADTRYDGSIFQIRTIATVVSGYEQTWEKVITIFEDITDRKANEQALIEAKSLAEHANRAKSDFLSSMSHELRTPLGAILGFAELLEYDDDLAEKHLYSIREISQAGEHRLRLIDEILDLSLIESGET